MASKPAVRLPWDSDRERLEGPPSPTAEGDMPSRGINSISGL
jgi:hypothetical protein